MNKLEDICVRVLLISFTAGVAASCAALVIAVIGLLVSAL